MKDKSSDPDQEPTGADSPSTPTIRTNPTIGTREVASQRGQEVPTGVISVTLLITIARTVPRDRVECPTVTTCREGEAEITTTSSLLPQEQKETEKCSKPVLYLR